MRLVTRLCVVTAVSSVLVSGASGVAAADPGDGCTVNGEPPGQFVTFVAQTFGHSGTLNPGNAHNPFPPFVPAVVGCNPTGNPSPPNP